MDSDGFPLRSFWSTPPGAQRLRQAVSPGKVSLLGFQWVRALSVCVTRKAAHMPRASGSTPTRPLPCALTLLHRHHRHGTALPPQMCALLVFVCISSQRAGLWGPSPTACALCNGGGPSGQCTTGRGGPHGLGCPYTAFGQFQCVATPARGAGGRSTAGIVWDRRSADARASAAAHPARFLCAVGIMWWIATATLLLFACGGRNPPLMTVRCCSCGSTRDGM